jgi:hypothetical protein
MYKPEAKFGDIIFKNIHSISFDNGASVIVRIHFSDKDGNLSKIHFSLPCEFELCRFKFAISDPRINQ